MNFEVHAIPTTVLDRAREDGAGPRRRESARVVADGGEPVRCCLRDALPGEELLLFSYEPPLPASPYREIGAVFAHAATCAGPDTAVGDHPADWRGRPQVLRAYDRRGWIHPNTRVHDGSDPEAAIAEVLADPEVVQVHSRNVAYGCFMFVATRPGAGHPALLPPPSTCSAGRSAEHGDPRRHRGAHGLTPPPTSEKTR